MNRFPLLRVAAFVSVASLSVFAIQAFAKPTAAKTKRPVIAAARGFAGFPPQSKVAAHTTFLTVPASSAGVRQAVPALNAPPTAKINGKRVTIQGTVLKVVRGGANEAVTISFGPNFRGQLSARISHQDYSKLPDLNTLIGKRVLISGTITRVTKWPQIEITRPDQIHVVQ